jgi:hypothetical protein
MDDMMRRQLPLLLMLVAAGCAVAPRAPETQAIETPVEATERRGKAAPPTYNLTGYPPAVRDGYIDGCESAKNSSFARKDARRMTNDAQYSMGWNDGFSICKPK